VPLHACHARNRAAEPGFEIGRERRWAWVGRERRQRCLPRPRSKFVPAQKPADCRQPNRRTESHSVFLRYQRLGGGRRGTGIKPSPLVYQYFAPAGLSDT
jgi:hypothetical protein